MSGIVGVVKTREQNVERDLLLRLTKSMSDRGPDDQQIWADGVIGFGHASLRTTFEASTERQPLTFNGLIWLVADARIDGRSELIQKLESHFGHKLSFPDSRQDPNDAELILHAYHAWGDQCVEHLLGDFSFAIWDSDKRQLFCARDHFGVKPFYYSALGTEFLFSNTIRCLRLHPSVSSRLNEKALGDFLLFDMNYDLSTTVFADIQRLPPAHTLTYSPDKEARLNRYWSLPVDGCIRYRRSRDYLDHFKDLLQAATEDRLRTDRVGVYMSGGLDSTSIAATANTALRRKGSVYDFQAYTIVYENLIPDDERQFAELVAETLGIKINVFTADDYRVFERHDERIMWRSEPIAEPFMAGSVDQYGQIAQQARVLLSGYGPDAVLSTHFPAHHRGLWQARKRWRVLSDLIGYWFWNHHLPPIGVRTFLRQTLRGRRVSQQRKLPGWLNPDFVLRMRLQERYEEINAEETPRHLRHPAGYNALARPFWPFLFERDNEDLSRWALEPRYPFFDVRLVSYFLAIPVVRWCTDKRLLREAMKGILPEEVRVRRKTPLGSDVLSARIRRGDSIFHNGNAIPELKRYVIHPPNTSLYAQDSDELWCDVRLQSFYDWMSQTLGAEYGFEAPGKHHYAGV
jgi:asparagine synthase (glutamine-hydrolysing)